MAVYDSSPIHLIWDPKGKDIALSQYNPSTRLGRESSLKAHKQLPRRRDIEELVPVAKTRYTISSELISSSDSGRKSATPSTVAQTSPNPILPLTPPTAHLESESEGELDTPVTPTPLQKPPTPDYTPPRRFLVSQLSLASTRAESFRTAREEFVSDDDFEAPSFTTSQRRSPGTPSSIRQRRRRPTQLVNGTASGHASNTPDPSDVALPDSRSTSRSISSSPYHPVQGPTPSQIPNENEVSQLPSLPAASPYAHPHEEVTPRILIRKRHTISPESYAATAETNSILQRGLSLRERVIEARQNMVRRSTEDFGDTIGWSNQDEEPEEELEDAVTSWRKSTASMGSAIEAFVLVDNTPKRQQTLRHIGKNLSLRSASSPIPAPNRDFRGHFDETPIRSSSISGSPTLHHKKARLSDQSRWSYGSELSRSLSITTNGVLPKADTEVIRVAVIPERASSLKSSANSSRRVSVVSTGGRNGSSEQYPPSSYHGRENSTDTKLSYRRRTLSDTNGSPRPKGRDQPLDPSLPLDEQPPPSIPHRSSSLSAPTSRSNSRANSLSSNSDHLRHRRIAAEKDLRKTLDKMESERLLPTLRSLEVKGSTPVDQEAVTVTPSRTARPKTLSIETHQRNASDKDTNGTNPAPEPGSDGWANLRPSSLLDTPFSQPSNVSMSPGPVEMGQAREVNFFPHNNDSLQLIEKHPLQESRAAREAHQRLLADEPSTPSTTTQVRQSVDSPLRNPREPPQPPEFKVIPPTPAVDKRDRQLPARTQSARRPSIGKQRYSGSFVKSLTRNLSLRNPRNRKVDQDLDGRLHPFWRPRYFWDGMSDSDNEDEDGVAPTQERSLVKTSIWASAPENTDTSKPMSLIRRLSSRRRQQGQEYRANAGVEKKSSYNSLQRIRAGRKLHTIPGLGLRFQIIGLRDIQDRMLRAKQRKEDEKRDRRREDLRRSIGANVVSRGDSRFPMTSTGGVGVGVGV